MSSIDSSLLDGTPKVLESIVAALHPARTSGDSLSDVGSGSVGRIRADRDGRTATSGALRFNIVISVAFTERGTRIYVVRVPRLAPST